MDIIELIAVIILVAAIVFLVYYYVQTVNNGSINIKEVLKFSPKKDDNINSLVDEEIQEKKSMGDKIKYTFKDIDKSYANTTDAFSRRLDSFLDERSEELIENWSLEKRFSEFTNATDAKIEDLDKRLKALEEAEKDLEEAEEAEEAVVEAEKE